MSDARPIPTVIKLLVVDDSALMRRQLMSLFAAESDFSVRVAGDGNEAVALNRSFQPDVVTLDIHMPGVDGLTALSLIMLDRPVPVVMISSLATKSALATLEALNLGAVDYVLKPSGTLSGSLDAIRGAIVSKVRAAASASLHDVSRKSRSGADPEAREPLPLAGASRKREPAQGVVLIGASTGGPRTLERILPALRGDLPWSVLIAQHMPASFTKPFARRLNALCAASVVEVSVPMPLESGTVYIGKGDADMQLVNRGDKASVLAMPANPRYAWHPSVEFLGRSALELFPPEKVLAVMLTGMGQDGADAFTQIRHSGGRTIAQSRESAILFGMPAELIARGGATITLPAEQIAAQINVWAGK
jgi:two-component system chemotaxis response regulator CheB